MEPKKVILVVLGYPANNDGTPGPILKARLDKAIELYRQGIAAKIIVTGAAVDNQFVESEVMLAYCLQKGIPQADILVESHAKNTFENARMVKEIIKDRGFKRAIVVTSSFHKMRAKRFFAKVMGNVEIVAAPFPANFPIVKRAVFLIKEYLILILYSLGLLNNRYSLQQS